MITVKDIFNYVRIINPAQHSSSSFGSYSTAMDNQIADGAIKEISDYLPEGTLARQILMETRGRYTDKQLWVISYELLKSESFVAFMEARKAEREEEEAYEKAKRAIKARKRKEKKERAEKVAEEIESYMSAEEIAELGAGEVVAVRLTNGTFEATVKEVQGDKIILVINGSEQEKMFLVAYVKIMKVNKEEINKTENNADEETCQPQNENKMEIRNIRTFDNTFTFDMVNTEVYTFRPETNRKNIHTDNIKYEDVTTVEQLRELVADMIVANGSVDIDVCQMDEKEYNSTICANCGEVFTDIYEKNDIVTIVTLK